MIIGPGQETLNKNFGQKWIGQNWAAKHDGQKRIGTKLDWPKSVMTVRRHCVRRHRAKVGGSDHCTEDHACGFGSNVSVPVRARVWRDEGPSHKQGLRVLGIPIGHVDFVQAQVRSTTEMHRDLHERLLSVQDLQSAWLLLLFCANDPATCSLRGIPSSEVAFFEEAHDEATW